MPHENQVTERTDARSDRRQFVTRSALGLGGLGLLGVPGVAMATRGKEHQPKQPINDPQTILNVAATAEVLATIVNTVAWERELGEDDVTQRNLRSAAREELIHYNTLVSRDFGGEALTLDIWVPDAVFASRTDLLDTLEVGDQIFINAYLVAVRTFGLLGEGGLAAVAAQFMGVEAVHRALARQSNGKLGNDRAYMRFVQPEEAEDAPNVGQDGFIDILVAVEQLQAAGFGFGEEGSAAGSFFNFLEVSERTPEDDGVNTRMPATGDEEAKQARKGAGGYRRH